MFVRFGLLSQTRKSPKCVIYEKYVCVENCNSYHTSTSLSLSSGGSMRRYVTRHCRFNNQPWIPCRVWQQPGLHMVNPRWTWRHYSSRLQWLLIRGQVWLPGNQRDRGTKHMVRNISYTDYIVLFYFMYQFICKGQTQRTLAIPEAVSSVLCMCI